VLRRAPAVVVMLLASSLPVSAQSLGQAAARERERRGTADASSAVVSASQAFAAEPLPSDQTPASSGPLLVGDAPRQDAYGRHLASAEAYLRQCEERLQAALLTAGEASQASDATRSRLVVERAAGALGRARGYRDQAEVAARVAGAPPAALP
jgi:hypothetical protein